MRFIKIRRDAAYTVIPNDIFESEEMNLKEIGLLSFLLHLPDSWDFSIEGIVSILKNDGRSSVMAGLNKLESLGYIARWQNKENGLFGNAIWIVSDSKMTESDIAEVVAKNSHSPSYGFPTSENPTVYHHIMIL